MLSSGLSTCCSTLMSAIPSTSEMAALISWPIECILLRSVPKTLMAIFDCVPDSIASILCEIGPPISIFTPGRTESFSRTSSVSACLLLPFSSKGHSNSEQFTPNACSSSSARPVLRPTVIISGILMRISSAWSPSLSDSSSDIPGTELMAMVKDPSLKAGRKLRPREKNMTSAATSRQANVPMTAFRCLSAQSSALA